MLLKWADHKESELNLWVNDLLCLSVCTHTHSASLPIHLSPEGQIPARRLSDGTDNLIPIS